MSYVETTISKLRANLGPNDGSVVELLRFYALLVHSCGVDTTLEDVHTAWALWRSQTKPDHPDLVEFAELSPEVADYDRSYRDVIRHVAAERSHLGGW